LLYATLAIAGILDAAQTVYAMSEHARTRSIKGYVQLGKIALYVVAAIAIVATIIDRSPWLLLSGLGAMSAVLLLVFKDTIMSFVASVQLTSNDMLRVGDWIEMPQVGADGDVVDIALHTVKVQNWDKTITTIPTWRLISESFRNWRGMQQSGGRRIKRTLCIDAGSVGFLDEAEIARLSKLHLLGDYLSEKQRSLADANAALGIAAGVPANTRRLTNLGTFRAYALAYLTAHPNIHDGMTCMVRSLQPSATGIPVELYCFTNTIVWAEYERVQGDVFDHLLAILPEFGLRMYQNPAGADLMRWQGQLAA
jgi:miniconductance mechanosensitive channel